MRRSFSRNPLAEQFCVPALTATAHFAHKARPRQLRYLCIPGYSWIFARIASLRRLAPSGISNSMFSRTNFTLGIACLHQHSSIVNRGSVPSFSSANNLLGFSSRRRRASLSIAGLTHTGKIQESFDFTGEAE